MYKKDLVQVKSSKTGHYMLIDVKNANIIRHKHTPGPFGRIRIVNKRPEKNQVLGCFKCRQAVEHYSVGANSHCKTCNSINGFNPFLK